MLYYKNTTQLSLSVELSLFILYHIFLYLNAFINWFTSTTVYGATRTNYL